MKADFSGGAIASNGGVLLLRQAHRPSGLTASVARRARDARRKGKVEHHFALHNTRIMMETNMNLTFPIADWLFGTSDLDRGLPGHLFNGYSTRYTKKGRRGTPVPPEAWRRFRRWPSNGLGFFVPAIAPETRVS